jgi:transposase
MAMKKRTRNSWISKLFSGCGKGEAHIGMDVHKETVSIAVWIDGRIVKTWKTPSDYRKISGVFIPFADKIARVVYEAGCTGYGLAREFLSVGINTDVVAPGKTPRPSSRENKSDRVDCVKLAEYSAKDLLQAVSIPTESEEAARQLIRLRDELVSKRRRIKNHIKGFLLNYSIAEPEGLKRWTKVSLKELRSLRLRSELRFTLDVMLDELDHFNSQVSRATKEIGKLSQKAGYSARLRLVKSHPGVGLLTAMTFLTEVYRNGRFENGAQVSRYTGLAPHVRESGSTRKEGSIQKTGRGSVRAMLVEAAWRWISNDSRARMVYERLKGNTGSAKKAIVGMARRLAVNLWTMLENKEYYRRTG